jgi:hypothetical protein
VTGASRVQVAGVQAGADRILLYVGGRHSSSRRASSRRGSAAVVVAALQGERLKLAGAVAAAVVTGRNIEPEAHAAITGARGVDRTGATARTIATA